MLPARPSRPPGEGDDHVVGGDHAEIAVARLARMHEIGGRAGRGQGGGHFAPTWPLLPMPVTMRGRGRGAGFDRLGEIVDKLAGERGLDSTQALRSRVWSVRVAEATAWPRSSRNKRSA